MEGVTVEKLEEVIHAEIAKVAATGPTAGEMERLKNEFEYSFLAGLEPLLARAVQLNEYDAYTGSPDYLAKDLAQYRSVTAEGIAKVAKEWLSASNASAIVIRPEAPAKEGK